MIFLILLNLLLLSMNMILFDLDFTNLNLASLEGIQNLPFTVAVYFRFSLFALH
jgi:hypothetical protein